MTTSTTSRWLLGLGLLALSPAALAAQNDTGQPVGQEDNTSYGTTSAEFLLLGAGARGRRWAAASPPSPPTSARSTTTPPGRP